MGDFWQGGGSRLAILQEVGNEVCPLGFILFYFLKIYLFIYDRHREREAQRHRRREKQTRCREPDVGMDPGTPGSRPGPKAGAKPVSYTHLTLPTTRLRCRSRWSPYH